MKNEKQKLYGQLLIDFVNAKTYDDVPIKYIENLTKAFDLYNFNFNIQATKHFLSIFNRANDPLDDNDLIILKKITENSPDGVSTKKEAVERIQAILKRVVEDIICDKIDHSRNDQDFYKILAYYNAFLSKTLSCFDGKFDETPVFSEMFLLSLAGDHYDGPNNFALEYYVSPLFFSLMEFLKNPENKNHLKKCPYCGLFFIGKDMKKKICYSKECFRRYKRLQKQKQREVNPVKYL